MVDRLEVLAFRVHAQQLDRARGKLTDTAVLDVGVQDTGPDGAMWALALRGVEVAKVDEHDLVTLWSRRRLSRFPTLTRASASSTRRSR